MPRSNLMVVQGGGPTAVFNTSLAAIIAEAQRQPSINSIYGAHFGVRGLITGDIADLTTLSAKEIETLKRTPGAALGSSRHSPAEGELDRLAAVLRRYDIDSLIFVGGNGTMGGAHAVSEFCKSHDLDVRVIGVPKTIDNDIASTDRCPGYASAARYIATAARELGVDVRSLPQPVTILETMGRNVGWIAAAAALAAEGARGREYGPHLVYIPEVAFDCDEFLSSLDGVVREIGWAVVVISEGICKADGSFVYQTTDAGQSDPLKRPMTGGVAQHLASVVSQRLRIRCRSEKPGLLGRASMALVSEQDRTDAVDVGRTGVEALVSGERDVMVSLNPLGEKGCSTKLIPLASASTERSIPSNWLQTGPIPVTQDFFNYLRPLVGPLDEHMTEIGTPTREKQEH
ncbi:MAG TPA: diphosphate--fructose-6-phosphate 1-phosphotransferase [Edaphobacter sp.]|nr:diphosphate--fructose-6-phosphate 1-phosphotransferase [Edaphobacter sp.]